jgi:hypothetical protein
LIAFSTALFERIFKNFCYDPNKKSSRTIHKFLGGDFEDEKEFHVDVDRGGSIKIKQLK